MRQGSHHPHLGSSSALPSVSASVRSARGKLLTLCSVNTRAGEACRFPFPQPCEVSAHRQNSSQCPPTEGSNNGKRQLAALPRGAALSQPYPPPTATSVQGCQAVGREQSWWGAKFWVFFFWPFLLTPLSLAYRFVHKAKLVLWLSRLLSDTPAQRRELKPYKLLPLCAFCDQPALAPSEHPCVQVELCQKL